MGMVYNMDPLTADQAKIVEDNHKLIYWLCIKYSIDIAEYYDILALGLIKAAKIYQPEFKGRAIKFSTLAIKVMLNEYYMEIRGKQPNTRSKYSMISLDSTINEESESNISDIIFSLTNVDSNFADVMDSKIVISEALRTLTNAELEILKYKMLGYKSREVSEKLGKSISYVGQTFMRIKRKISGYSKNSKNARAVNTEERSKNIKEIIGILGISYESLNNTNRNENTTSNKHVDTQKGSNKNADTQKGSNKNADTQKGSNKNADTQKLKNTREFKNNPGRPKRAGKITAIYAGSFDPITYGHLDIIKKASKLFDRLIIAVGVNSSKNYTFSIEDRKEMIKGACKEVGIRGVEVESFDGLLMEYANKVGAKAIIRGLRETTDFCSEYKQILVNRSINPEIESVLIVANSSTIHISSSMVKEVYKLGGDISEYVTSNVKRKIKDKKGLGD